MLWTINGKISNAEFSVAMATIGPKLAPFVEPDSPHTPTSSPCARVPHSRCFGPPKLKLQRPFSMLLSNVCVCFSALIVGHVEQNFGAEFPHCAHAHRITGFDTANRIRGVAVALFVTAALPFKICLSRSTHAVLYRKVARACATVY